MASRVTVDGKFFTLGDDRFHMRGVSYGTFKPRDDGHRFPDRTRVKHDFAAMNERGFTVVRTYVPPPDDVVELAADWDLRLLSGAFYPDWRYLVGASRRQARRVLDEARAEVRRNARRFAGSEQVFALSLGNEIPADVVRWVGTGVIAAALDGLADVVREEDPELLVTYANYPTAEYLPLDGLDFLTFNVFLERQQDLRRYLTRLHHLAGDRPLTLGEVGLDAGNDAGGEAQQAATLDWTLETAVERGVAGTCVFSWTDEWWVGDSAVEGWHFGLTRADRSPRASLDVAAQWNHRTVRDLDRRWPSISVVVCAYNAESTIDECLRHASALDYPDLELIVVDDGSDDATADIARRHPRARLLQIGRQGLSAARNEGFRAARGEVVAYLDSDAYPTPEWPWYLALGFDSRTVGGVGGPNVPPTGGTPGAECVARAAGGPVHVLLTDDRAEHVPGCNMAFWKKVLAEVDGFDPIYRAAGDDVDLCWKVLDRGWEIGFHPAALVWHHRRSGLVPYLRQQRGYGRAEALVEARHPDRFTAIGTARWRGRIYDSVALPLRRQRIYRGAYGTATFQSSYDAGGHHLDLAHQAGVPVAGLLAATTPLGLLAPTLAIPGALALVALVVLFVIDAGRASPPRGSMGSPLRHRLGVAAMNLLQPVARSWGRSRTRRVARTDAPAPSPLPEPIARFSRNVVVYPRDRDREVFAADVVAHLHRAGFRMTTGTGWEDHDARVLGSGLIAGDIVTSAHPEGCIQLKVRRRPRAPSCALVGAAVTVSVILNPLLAASVASIAALSLVRGLSRTGPRLHRRLRAGTTPPPTPPEPPDRRPPRPAPHTVEPGDGTSVGATAHDITHTPGTTTAQGSNHDHT